VLLWFNFCNISTFVKVCQHKPVTPNQEKMKSFKKLILLVVLLLAFTSAYTQESDNEPLPSKIVQAVKKGDAAELAPFLNSKVELVLPSKSGIFSKEQAHFILKSFFEDNKVTSFNIIHHGTRQNATFAIGQYNCPNENYRMYFLVKKNGEQTIIHQIRIEKQE